MQKDLQLDITLHDSFTTIVLDWYSPPRLTEFYVAKLGFVARFLIMNYNIYEIRREKHSAGGDRLAAGKA